MDNPPLDDETIDRIAEESFLEYDAREAVDVESGAGRGLHCFLGYCLDALAQLVMRTNWR
jgi:hypothetical protein